MLSVILLTRRKMTCKVTPTTHCGWLVYSYPIPNSIPEFFHNNATEISEIFWGIWIEPGTELCNPGRIHKMMKGYHDLDTEVEYFYRSMNYLLKIKDELELAIFHRLRDLFSVNVRLTFYDITSTFFYSDACPIGAKGVSRDMRPDLEQVVIGVAVGYRDPQSPINRSRSERVPIGDVVKWRE